MTLDAGKILTGARLGNRGAIRKLIRTYGAGVQRLAYQLVGNVEDARDIAQDVFIRLVRNRHRYDPKRPFETWLNRIVINLSHDHRRANRRHGNAVEFVEESAPPARGADPSAQVEEKELRGALNRLLADLSPQQRQVFVLRDLQDCPVAEIGEILDLKPSTVRVHLARARRLVRAALTNHYPDCHGGE
ncbi:MAG: RNA polymerase sigma factor [bacterium]|nr:RNA polymerase sigma factor [bacterium]